MRSKRALSLKPDEDQAESSDDAVARPTYHRIAMGAVPLVIGAALVTLLAFVHFKHHVVRPPLPPPVRHTLPRMTEAAPPVTMPETLPPLAPLVPQPGPHELPSGVTGPQTEIALSSMVESVHPRAWVTTGAVRWTMVNGRTHLWDRARRMDAQTMGDDRVLINLETHRGKAWHAGVELTGSAATTALAAAWAAWIHDSFWLNPLIKVYDPAVTHELIKMPDGRFAVLVTFPETTNDPVGSMLLIPGEDHHPVIARLWFADTPVPGLEVSWEGWSPIGTDSMVSTRHHGDQFAIDLTDVSAARTLNALVPGPDPFAAIAH